MDVIRKLHNDAKRDLIQRAVRNGQRALDVGCGFGGDIHKWAKVNAHVDMCDPNEQSVIEARKRIKEMGSKIRVIVGDIRDCQNIKYDIICYNFSLQYIFENEKLFFDSIKNIKKRLKVGGKLIGCIPDAEKILMVRGAYFRDEIGNYFMRSTHTTGFGRLGEQIQVYLVDTPYYAFGPKPEPIAYQDILITHLENIGIMLDTWEPLVDHHTGPEISKLYRKFIFTHIKQ